MSALICGSIAFDTIMVFHGRFRDHILPDQLHMLNIAFLVPGMRQGFGGCAGNIAYNLSLLGGECYPMGTVGKDFSRYAEWMDGQAVDRRYVMELEDQYTASAFIITDLDDNQITAFHPGAMDLCHLGEVPSDQGIRFGVVSPEGREGMLAHARQFAAAGVPYLFDPGQGTPMFDEPELTRLIKEADWLACNEYESSLIVERTGRSLKDLAGWVRALIVTLGKEGSVIYVGGDEIKIPAVVPKQAEDPTGCGDAYRAGLLYGLQNDMDWETTGRIASLMGAIKVESSGTQQHAFAPDEFRDRFRDSFGYAF